MTPYTRLHELPDGSRDYAPISERDIDDANTRGDVGYDERRERADDLPDAGKVNK